MRGITRAAPHPSTTRLWAGARASANVLTEIRDLELSNASVAFADELREQSRHTEEFVVEFKWKIAKCEKALGEDGKEGAQHGVARKVQWAVIAGRGFG
jgi:hypothetical protein